MAKEGIPSFLLDCRTNDNISEIEAEYGVKGFAVVVRLWQKIYAEKGYYCEWVERSPLLFLSNWFGGNSGVTVSLINEIVKRCLNNGIFDVKMHEDYSILTSARIQEQYFDAVKRRKEILVKKQYLLVSVDKIESVVYENDVSVCRNQENVCRNYISEDKVNEDRENARATESMKRFEEFLSAYPKECNYFLAEWEYASLLLTGKITEEELVQSARNYAETCRILETPERYIKNAENFLKEFVFEQYFPAKYKKPAPKKQKNSFNKSPQREYDFNKLERKLLSSNFGGS
mgnify:CR=1 FL=1